MGLHFRVVSNVRWIPLLAVVCLVAGIIASVFGLILDDWWWASISVAFALAGVGLSVLTGKEELSPSSLPSPGSSSSTRRAPRSTSTGPSH